MHCSGVTLSSNLEGFVASSMNSDLYFLFSIGFKSDDCLAILAALFSFSETSREFPWLCLGSSSSSWYCRCWD